MPSLILSLDKIPYTMIAQIVFDLPLDGPFDYLIPEHLAPKLW